jgi:uncharacterized protein DUF3303
MNAVTSKDHLVSAIEKRDVGGLRPVVDDGWLLRYVDEARMLYLIIEHFKDSNPVPVYRRFRDQGRMMPTGLSYVSSWVTQDFAHCYQIMECDTRGPLDDWIGRWADLVEFEVIPVVTSADAQKALAPRL